MDVAHLLATKGHDVTTVSAERPVRDAVELLRERGIGALVVVDGRGPLAGILSERDVVRALARSGAGALDERVRDLMTADVVTCEPATTITALMTTMTERRIRHVPVLDDGRLVGLVSIGDVVKARVDDLERERRELLDYVSAR